MLPGTRKPVRQVRLDDHRPERLPVAESGLGTHDDLLRLRRAGASCFLVGERLLQAVAAYAAQFGWRETALGYAAACRQVIAPAVADAAVRGHCHA